MEEETVIMHCCYCTCGVISSTPTTRTELLDMDIAKTSTGHIKQFTNIIFFNVSDFRHCYFLSVPIKQVR